MQQRTPEWYEARKGRITGSNVGAILGLDPSRTREDVLRAMVREYHGAPSEFTGNIATEWGNRHEALAISTFELTNDIEVQETGFHPFEDWAGASPDGLIGTDAVFENKCPFGIRNQDPPQFKTLDAQPHYYAQIQFEMVCTGRDKAYFHQWTPHGTVYVIRHKDQAWLDHAMPELRQFYAFYLSDLDNPDHLEPLRITIETKEAVLLVAEYDEMREAEERAKERKAEIVSRLSEMTNGKDGLIAGRKLTLVKKEGAISYAKAIKALAPKADLEPYRGAATSYWKIT